MGGTCYIKQWLHSKVPIWCDWIVFRTTYESRFLCEHYEKIGSVSHKSKRFWPHLRVCALISTSPNVKSKLLPLEEPFTLCFEEARKILNGLHSWLYKMIDIIHICCCRVNKYTLCLLCLHAAQRAFSPFFHLSGSSRYFSSFFSTLLFLSASKWLKCGAAATEEHTGRNNSSWAQQMKTFVTCWWAEHGQKPWELSGNHAAPDIHLFLQFFVSKKPLKHMENSQTTQTQFKITFYLQRTIWQGLVIVNLRLQVSVCLIRTGLNKTKL